MPSREVTSAGAVVLGPHRQVLLVHRPKYDDWSFPKGKLDPGEHPLTAAVREVREESEVRVRIGLPLERQRYPISVGTKLVHYWLGRPVGAHDVRRYQANEEIDAVRWVDVGTAPALLTYQHDQHTLEQACSLPRKTRTLIVLRHGAAQSRKTFRHSDDARRPLLLEGRRQADRLVPMLAAYGVQRVATSTSARCIDTVAPYARQARRSLERLEDLSEERATPDRVARLTRMVVADLQATPSLRAVSMLCTHRPVLPWVCAALGVPDPHLEKAEMLVVHLVGGDAVGCERHRAG